jgi:hypothetical protein
VVTESHWPHISARFWIVGVGEAVARVAKLATEVMVENFMLTISMDSNEE